MTASLRLFVAIDLPERQLRRLDDAVAPLRESLADARWIPRPSRHVTLKFLGPTPPDRLDDVAAVVATVARSHDPVATRVGDLGVFASLRRARVLWAGVDDPGGVLAGIAADLDRGFEPLGYRTEERAFTPHLTLARFKVPQRLSGLPRIDAAAFDEVVVDRLTLYRSRLHPSGASYEALASFALGSGDAAG